jgi:hypothetical protein
MLRAMERCTLLLALLSALVACGGGIQPYWSNNDAGYCEEHASKQYCKVSGGPCDGGGPPDSPDTGNGNLSNTAIVTCTP